MKSKLSRAVLIAIVHFTVCILSGAAGWELQMFIVSIAGIITVVLTCRVVNPQFFTVALIIAPFYLLYVPASIYLRSYYTYPIWMFGLLVCIFTWMLIRLKISRLLTVPILIVLVFTGGCIVWPNTYSYLESEDDPKQYSLNASRLVDETGKNVNAADWKGKVVLFDIWHSACYPCIKKFPEIQRLYDDYRDDSLVRIISLNFPLKKDGNKRPSRFTDPYSFEKMYFFDEKEYRKFSEEEVPLVLILDKKGECRYAGSLNTGWNIFIGNTRTIIRRLKNEP